MCLKGLFETDGSIYSDRGYLMAMFVTVIPELAGGVLDMISALGFSAHAYRAKQNPPQQTRYNIIRVSKGTPQFIDTVNIYKD
jgi:hypothetical protein